MWSRKGVFSFVAFALVSQGAWADITITQLANEGVVISDGTTRVMIDGLVVEPYSVYGGLSEEAAAMFKAVSGPYANIDLALVSHQHHEHNQPAFACDFLKKSKDTIFVSSAQVLGLMREKCRELVTTSPRIREIDPQYGEPEVFEVKGAKVTVFPLSHGVFKFAKLQNYGHLIEIGGVTVLHIGDADANPADFETAGLDQVKLDVALIPYGFFRPGPSTAIVQKYLDAPLKIAVHIPPGEMDETRAEIDANYPGVTILDAPLKEITVSSAGQ